MMEASHHHIPAVLSAIYDVRAEVKIEASQGWDAGSHPTCLASSTGEISSYAFS